MSHHIRGFISSRHILRGVAIDYASAAVFDLNDDFGLLPMTDALSKEIRNQFPPSIDVALGETINETMLDLVEARFGEVSSAKSLVAYIETEFHGGTGTQFAIAWSDGRIKCGPEYTEGSGAINKVLATMGVKAMRGFDEFDTLGLQHYRYPEEFERPDGVYCADNYFKDCIRNFPLTRPSWWQRLRRHLVPTIRN